VREQEDEISVIQVYEEMIDKNIGTEDYWLYLKYSQFLENPSLVGKSKVKDRDYLKADQLLRHGIEKVKSKRSQHDRLLKAYELFYDRMKARVENALEKVEII
jgi:hypothetical protein